MALKGETIPILVGIDYSIVNSGDMRTLTANQVTFSREWANLMFQDFCPPEARAIEIKPYISVLL